MNEDELADRLETGGHRPGADGATRQPGDDLAELLRDAATWAEPEPGGADALLAAIRAERGEDVGLWPVRTGEPSPWSAAYGRAEAVDGARSGAYREAGVIDGVRRRAAHRSADRAGATQAAPGRPSLWRWPAAAAAAALVLVVGAAGLLAVQDGNHERGPEGEAFDIAGTEMAPDASAVATVDAKPAGVAIVLDVHGLPPAAPGTYYQAWVEGGAGKVTVGSFHMRGGDGWIYLWSGVEAARYPMLQVTLEHEGDGEQASDDVVLVGSIDS
ncbi:MAG TPA: anti-sigma factor [Acidimicrobiales bacterium]|nr:anti-sigma factor [Acidimicrobiales bacterium]